jgi:hypothetical protein
VASYSPVLEAAFNSGFVEGQTQTYNLEHTSPGVFQLLVQWLYTKSVQFRLTDAEINSIPIAANGLRNSDRITSLKLTLHSLHLLLLWVTAAYLQIPRLQNLVVGNLDKLQVHWSMIAPETLPYLYENVPSEAPIRLLICQYCVRYYGHNVYRDYSHCFPRQILVDLIVAQKVKEELNGAQLPQPDPFTDRAEFIKRFHVPEDVQSPRNGAA